jgi:hypothetical protein
MPSSPDTSHDQHPGDHPGRGSESHEHGAAGSRQAEGWQRQSAVLAERDPGTVAFALAAFRRLRGFERSGLAAWLGITPDQLVALTLEPRPDRAAPEYEDIVAGLARLYGVNPARLAEALTD